MTDAIHEELIALAQGDDSEAAEEFLIAVDAGDPDRLAQAKKDFVGHLVQDGTIELDEAPGYLASDSSESQPESENDDEPDMFDEEVPDNESDDGDEVAS